MKFLLVAILFCISLEFATSRMLNKCEIATELLKQGFDKALLSNWVCLVQSESGGKTEIIGTVNSNGSRDYGLFQINNKIWCKMGGIGGDCKVSCESLITDDITKAATCAKKIYARHKFFAWNGWKSKCQGTLPNLSDCKL